MPIDPQIIRELDELVRASIQHLVDRYFGGLKASTIAVVIGVSLELPDIYYEIVEWFRKRRGLVISEKRGLIVLLSSVGLLFVILGVAGEYLFESMTSQAEGYLRSFDETLLANTQQETSRAYERAANAAREAEAANVKAGELEKEAAEERKRASSLEREAEELRKGNLVTEARLIKANQDLENEKQQRLAMEESLAPRELPIVCCGPASNFLPLVPFRPMNVTIEYVPDAEAKRAADEISGFLSTAGWTVVPPSPNARLNAGYYDGVIVEYYSGRSYVGGMPIYRNQADSERCSGAASQLLAILKANDWVARTDVGGDYSELPLSTIKIDVGMKPNRFPTRHMKEWEKRRDEWMKAHGYPVPEESK